MEKINRSFSIVKNVLIVVDKYISDKIDIFFFGKGYFSQNIIPELASNIPLFVRLTFYFVVLLFFLIPLKIVFPKSRIRSFLTYTSFVLIILGIFGIFFGFFQLMYSF